MQGFTNFNKSLDVQIRMGGLIPLGQGGEAPVDLIQGPPAIPIQSCQGGMVQGIGIPALHIRCDPMGRQPQPGGHLDPLPQPQPSSVLLQPEGLGDIAFSDPGQTHPGKVQGFGPFLLAQQGHGLAQKNIGLKAKGIQPPQVVGRVPALFRGEVGLHLFGPFHIKFRIIFSEQMEQTA